MPRGVKYDAQFKNSDGTITLIKEYPIKKLLSKLEELLKSNYDIDERLSNQVIYNLHSRQENVSKLLRLFVKVERIK